ncbi:MAG: NDP-sugar synthase [Myxococcales bacterium]|nr:NDP-sugar synthase [Myxococcales bacterium]
MIVAAGLGTRLRPLSELRPKPALPVRGIPLVAYQLALLASHGVSEVVINAHHLPDRLIAAARRYRPPGVELRFSVEPELLGTGGGIRRVAPFLRESDPCLILGGDMLVDADLGALVERHRTRGDALTLLLRRDSRSAEFGTIGLDREGRLRRIGGRFDLGSETQAGLYTWVNVVAARAFDTLPDRECFGHFDHWIGPRLASGAADIRGEVWSREQCTWEPVGTLREYLAVNLSRCPLGYFDADALARRDGTRFEPDLVIGAGASLEPGARLRRAVVWDGETVPAGLHASDGVFAGGAFHPCSGKAR